MERYELRARIALVREEEQPRVELTRRGVEAVGEVVPPSQQMDRVGVLVGQGDVGIDRRSPVHWGVYERHGAFPYTGALHAVTYRPGPRAPYAPGAVARASRESTRIYE